MASIALSLGYVANFGLGAVLAALAWQIGRRGSRADLWLAAFLSVVGVGYALDAVALVWPPAFTGLRAVVLALSRMDGALLLLFALERVGFRVARPLAALALAPGVILALLQENAPGAAHVAGLVGYYGASFVLIARWYANAATPVERDRRATLVLILGVVALARMPLLQFDLRAVVRDELASLLRVEGTLVLVAALAVGGLLLAARGDEARAHARRTSATLVALLAAVAAVWSLRFFPGLRESGWALAYAVRWYLVAILLALSLRDAAAARSFVASPRAIALQLLVLAATQIAALLAAIEGVSAWSAILGGMALPIAGAVAVWGVRAAFPKADADALRRQEAFRAHAVVGRDDARLERLREELDIAPDLARRIVAEARAQPPAIAMEGALFLGRYEVESLVGAGGFGRAFVAWDRTRRERVVLKELLAIPDEAALARLTREVEAATRISHPNLVGFRGIERGARGPVLVLQHVEGQTLRARLARGPLPEPEVRALAEGLAAALAALHAVGIVHRDVKPENVMLADGRVVLVDFGEALPARPGDTLAAMPAGGTPAYASPEQLRGDPVDARADVHAAAVTLWEALSGERPPAGEVPTAWRPLLLAGLAPDASARPSDARALVPP